MFWSSGPKVFPEDMTAFDKALHESGIARDPISYSVHKGKPVTSSSDGVAFVGLGQHATGRDVGFVFEVCHGEMVDGVLIAPSAAVHHRWLARLAKLHGQTLARALHALANRDATYAPPSEIVGFLIDRATAYAKAEEADRAAWDYLRKQFEKLLDDFNEGETTCDEFTRQLSALLAEVIAGPVQAYRAGRISAQLMADEIEALPSALVHGAEARSS